MLDAGARPQAVAAWAPTERAVEGELPRFERLEATAAARAGEQSAVDLDGPVGLFEGFAAVPLGLPRDEHRAPPRHERRLDALGEPAAGGGIGRDAVDDDLDPVLPLAVELRLVVEMDGPPVDPHAHPTGRLERCEEGVGGLADARLHRRQEEHSRFRRMGEEPSHGLVDAPGPDRHAALRAVHLPQPGAEDAEVVVHLRERADRRAGRAAGGPLFDRHRRRQPLDPLKEGLGHLADELAGIGAEALDIPPLPLGVEGVEGQRCLPRAARPAADGHGATGNVGIDRFEIVLAGAADFDRGGAGVTRGGRDPRQGVALEGRRIDGRALPRRTPGRRACGAGREDGLQSDAGLRSLRPGHLLRSSLGDDLSPAGAPLGAEVDHPVGPLHNVEVVLDDEDSVAGIDEPLEDDEELADVGHVEPGRRLVEDVERPPRRAFGELAGELHPLGFAPGECRGGLAEMEVIEAHIAERLELAGDVGGIGEQRPRVADLHPEEVGDVLPLPAHLEGVTGEPGSATSFASHPDIGEEVHVEPHRAVPLAGLAPPPGDVEAESPCLPATRLRIGEHREEVADVVPHLHVGRRVAPRRAADRRLIDDDHLVDLIGPKQRGELARTRRLAPELLAERWLEDVADQ